MPKKRNVKREVLDTSEEMPKVQRDDGDSGNQRPLRQGRSA